MFVPEIEALLVSPNQPCMPDDSPWVWVTRVPDPYICPRCGSTDVRDKGGHDSCNACGSRFGYTTEAVTDLA